jgi:hypothetical protein
MIVIADDLQERRYLVLSSSSTIPWDEINQDEGSDLATSVDGAYIIVELLEARDNALSQEDIRMYKESNIDNWTEPLN